MSHRQNTKSDIICPICKGSVSKIGRKDWSDRYQCDRCGRTFLLDTEEFLGDDSPIFFNGSRWYDHQVTDGELFDEVFNLLEYQYPEYRDLIRDPEIRDYIRDYELFILSIDHNAPDISECATEGYFMPQILDVAGVEPDPQYEEFFQREIENEGDDPSPALIKLYNQYHSIKARYCGRWF